MPIKDFLKKAEQLQVNLKKGGIKKPKPTDHDDSNWIVSYADMMTLLCVFFIMMFSMATINVQKYERLKEELSKEFGGKYSKPNEDLAQDFEKIIEDLKLQDKAEVVSSANGVTIVFSSTVFFDTLSATVKAQGKKVLSKFINAVHSKQSKEKKQYKIVVEGHTDGRSIASGPFPTNWELSGARASSVVRMFTQSRFEPKNLLALGLSDTRPLKAEKTSNGSPDPVAMAKNRRVVIHLYEPEVEYIPWDSIALHPVRN